MWGCLGFVWCVGAWCESLQDVNTSLQIRQRDEFLYSHWTWQKSSSKDCGLHRTSAHSCHHSTQLLNVEIWWLPKHARSNYHSMYLANNTPPLRNLLCVWQGPQSQNLNILGSDTDFMMISWHVFGEWLKTPLKSSGHNSGSIQAQAFLGLWADFEPTELYWNIQLTFKLTVYLWAPWWLHFLLK